MKIAVTRPLPEALATAERVRAMGHEAIVAPLTQTVAVDPGLVDLNQIDLVVISSANAIRFADPALLQTISTLPLVAVGDRTAGYAGQSGFADVTSGGGDVASLLAFALERTERGSKVLYLCGKVRRPDFEAGMERAGRRIVIAETYENRPVTLDGDVVKALQSAQIMLLHARSAADAVASIAADLQKPAAICMSARVAEPLKILGWPVLVAERPSEDAMLAAINRL